LEVRGWGFGEGRNEVLPTASVEAGMSKFMLDFWVCFVLLLLGGFSEWKEDGEFDLTLRIPYARDQCHVNGS
jgi:hypothetical protein